MVFFLVRRFFSNFKKVYIERLIFKAKKRKSLFFWATSLKRKVFRKGFLVYHEKTKKKQKRYLDALDERRNRMLRNGIAMWMKIAMCTKEVQTERAMRAQASKSYREYALAEKYGNIWRAKTIANRAKRAQVCTFDNIEGRANIRKLIKPNMEMRQSRFVPETSSGIEFPREAELKPKRSQPRRPNFLVGLFENSVHEMKENSNRGNFPPDDHNVTRESVKENVEPENGHELSKAKLSSEQRLKQTKKRETSFIQNLYDSDKGLKIRDEIQDNTLQDMKLELQIFKDLKAKRLQLTREAEELRKVMALGGDDSRESFISEVKERLVTIEKELQMVNNTISKKRPEIRELSKKLSVMLDAVS